MSISIKLNLLMAQQQIKSKELAKQIGISEQNFSLLKNGKIKTVRLEVLNALCRQLKCQPSDLLEYREDAW